MVQVTPVLLVPVTEAVIGKVALIGSVCAVVGLVMEIATESAVEGPKTERVG